MVATVLVVALFVWGGGMGLVEGIAIYAAVGLAVWYWGRGTFWSATLKPPAEDDVLADRPTDEAGDSVDGPPGLP